MQEWQTALSQYMPRDLRQALLGIADEVASTVTELRIRANRPLMACSATRDINISGAGETAEIKDALIITRAHANEVFERVTRSSVYAMEQELVNGYTTLPGGYRVGFCGKAQLRAGSHRIIAPCGSFNIRIIRELKGCADPVMPYITENGCAQHTLIISPPGMGKTTLLRDIVRQLSTGFVGFSGVHVGVVDERSEIAACYGGVPQTELGPRADVLDCCPKATGMGMLLRSMSPKVIAVDELARSEDAMAVLDALNAGVSVIATVHGPGESEVMSRPALTMLLKERAFERCVLLGRAKGVGTIMRAWDPRHNSELIAEPIRGGAIAGA